MPITVNGQTITDQAVNVESAFHKADDPRNSQYQAAVALVIRELLLQRATELGLYDPAQAEGEAGTAEDEAIDALLDREVPSPEADEAFCRTYFENNRDRFRSPDLFEARHILLAAAPDDLDGRDQARDLAEALIADLQAKPDTFAELARQHSACPSKEHGGNLGQLSRGQTVPEFEDALTRMEEGLAEQPIESRYGFHVVWVDRRIEGRPLEFEHVRPQIAEYLEEQSRRRAVSQYLKRLAGEAEIEGIDLEAAESPLVQ